MTNTISSRSHPILLVIFSIIVTPIIIVIMPFIFIIEKRKTKKELEIFNTHVFLTKIKDILDEYNLKYRTGSNSITLCSNTGEARIFYDNNDNEYKQHIYSYDEKIDKYFHMNFDLHNEDIEYFRGLIRVMYPEVITIDRDRKIDELI